MISALKVLFSTIFVFMCCIIVSTSLESNLFEEWEFLAGIPWMKATLWDFYANTIILGAWAIYKERKLAMGILWVVLFALLGSIATSAFMLVQLFRLRPGEGMRELVLTNAQPGPLP
jgi:hypothetical protein